VTETLITELVEARAELMALLDSADPRRRDAPDLVGEWSARELIAHLGYWAGHSVEVINAVESGRADEMALGEPSVDDRNETVARVARQTDLPTVKKREAASVQALVDRLTVLDPTLLDQVLPDGASLADGIREDGSVHYREHAEQLRTALERL